MLVWRNTDSGVDHGKRNNLIGFVQHLVAHTPSRCCGLDSQRYAAFGCEFEGVRQQVLEDLLQSLRVCKNGLRRGLPHIDVQLESLRGRYGIKTLLDEI